MWLRGDRSAIARDVFFVFFFILDIDARPHDSRVSKYRILNSKTETQCRMSTSKRQRFSHPCATAGEHELHIVRFIFPRSFPPLSRERFEALVGKMGELEKQKASLIATMNSEAAAAEAAAAAAASAGHGSGSGRSKASSASTEALRERLKVRHIFMS